MIAAPPGRSRCRRRPMRAAPDGHRSRWTRSACRRPSGSPRQIEPVGLARARLGNGPRDYDGGRVGSSDNSIPRQHAVAAASTAAAIAAMPAAAEPARGAGALPGFIMRSPTWRLCPGLPPRRHAGPPLENSCISTVRERRHRLRRMGRVAPKISPPLGPGATVRSSRRVAGLEGNDGNSSLQRERVRRSSGGRVDSGRLASARTKVRRGSRRCR